MPFGTRTRLLDAVLSLAVRSRNGAQGLLDNARFPLDARAVTAHGAHPLPDAHISTRGARPYASVICVFA